jgi:hypothetical protein
VKFPHCYLCADHRVPLARTDDRGPQICQRCDEILQWELERHDD